jgi:hypothetical protein
LPCRLAGGSAAKMLRWYSSRDTSVVAGAHEQTDTPPAGAATGQARTGRSSAAVR